MNNSISVAMAVYNGEPFIREQLDSIICQLKEDDEIVISYDKSSDKTWDIIKEYERNYATIKVIKNNNPGVFGNFENAIRNCSKDYIFISDQDDIWLPEKRSAVLSCFQENKCDMVIHNGRHINIKGEIISDSFFDLGNIKHDLIKNFVKPEYSGCCTVFSREFAQVILPIPRGVGAYDHWIGMTGELIGKVIFLDKILLYHRIHGNNVTPTRRRPLKVIAKARVNLAYSLLIRKIKWRRVR